MVEKTYKIQDTVKSFTPIGIDKIKAGAVAPLCLDDQWIEAGGYAKRVQPNRNINGETALKELKKALIFAPQIVVNRAFVLNTTTFTSLLDRDSKDRSHMLKLLNDHVIALYLWKNSDPLLGSDSYIDKSPRGERNWLQACQEVSPACVRFDWSDDKKDAELCDEKLEGKFKSRIAKLASADPAAIALAVDPNADQAKADTLKVVFKKLENIIKSEAVTRTTLYERFVWQDNPPRDRNDNKNRIIDYQKPCVVEIKQLLDIIYNTNLTDSLQISPLTPAGSLDRSILSEGAVLGEFVPMSGERAAAFVQRLYAEMRLGDLKPFGFERMSLEHIIQLRESPPWKDYHAQKLRLSEIEAFTDFEKFDDECINRAVIANESFKALTKEAFKEFGKYYVQEDAPAQNATRATFKFGGMLLGALLGGLAEGLPGALRGAAEGQLGKFFLDTGKALLEKKAGQTIETSIAMGIGAAAHRIFIPRIGWEDNEVEARKFVTELQKMGFGQSPAQAQLELFSQPSTIGYESKSEAPDYG